MEMTQTLDGILFSRMINAGAANLKAHAAEVNQLNVFPIPDGDTGDNMLLTMMGGVHTEDCSCERLCKMAEKVSGGMLLSARGNSGVILSQFFEGIKNGFAGLHTADTKAVGEAFRQGVAQAYRSVMSPAEGTILTVAREATEYACSQEARSPGAFLNAFITEAKQSLARTPELLPVLKKAGVVDSGAAGLIYIVDGMMQAVRGENIGEISAFSEAAQEPDLDAFDENSVLEFGYCTELLLRLQNAKVELSAFDLDELTAFLQTVGDSIVTVRNGSEGRRCGGVLCMAVRDLFGRPPAWSGIYRRLCHAGARISHDVRLQGRKRISCLPLNHVGDRLAHRAVCNRVHGRFTADHQVYVSVNHAGNMVVSGYAGCMQGFCCGDCALCGNGSADDVQA